VYGWRKLATLLRTMEFPRVLIW